MSTIKPDLTRIWASGAPGSNVIDPDVTTPGKVAAGWTAEIPPFEHFNFLQKWFTQGLAYANEQGIMGWDTNTVYPIDGLTKGSNGTIYRAIVEQNGNDPISDGGTNWVIQLTPGDKVNTNGSNSMTNPLNINSANPALKMLETDAPADEGKWYMGPFAGVFKILGQFDVSGNGTDLIQFIRDGANISKVEFIENNIPWTTIDNTKKQVSINTTGLALPGASRAPLFIFNNPATTAAGESSGLQIWIGDNPTATPAANDSVAQTNLITNQNGRTHLWGIDVVALQTSLGPDGMIRAAEFEVANGMAFHAGTDPWSGITPYRKNGIEIVAVQGGTHRLSSALTTWANGDTGDNWWNEGLSISRCYNTGLHFYADPSGSADLTPAFKIAAIYDQSVSANVLKVDNAHTNIMDFTDANFTNFIQLNDSQAQTLVCKNGADFDVGMNFDCGSTATQQITLGFLDQGVAKWSVLKDPSNDFIIFDHTNSKSAMEFDSTDANNSVLINVNGSLRKIITGAVDTGSVAGRRALEVLN